MVWLGLQFDTTSMTITIPHAKLTEIADLVADCYRHTHENLLALRVLLGKLFYVSQCCIPARFILNRILEILMSCPPIGDMEISSMFRKDLQWFDTYLPIHQ